MRPIGNKRLKHYTTLAARLAMDGHLLEMADLATMLVVDAGVQRDQFITSIQMDAIHCACSATLGEGKLDIFLAFVRKLHNAGFMPVRFVGDGTVALLSGHCKKLMKKREVDKWVGLLSTLSEFGFPVRGWLDKRYAISICAASRNLDAALRYARLLPRVNSYYNFILQEFGDQDLESIFNVFSTMTEAGIKPDVYTYRSLVDACANHGQVTRATSVFKDMTSSGIMPNVYIYNSLMNVYAKNTKAVWKLYGDMQVAGVKPELSTYNTMLKSCSFSKSFNKAFSLYKDMVSRTVSEGLKLDVFSYTTIIHILGDAGMWESALKVKEDMIASGVTPNVKTWTALLGACGNVGMVEQAFSLFNEMLIAGCAPNTHTYNMLIEVCCKGGQHERAFQLFKQWKEKGYILTYWESEQSGLVSVNGLTPAQLSEVSNSRKDKNFKTRNVSKTSSTRRSGCKPDLVTYNTLLKACQEEPHLAKEIMADIVSAGLTPNLLSWSSCINSCAREGDLKEAVYLFNEMKEVGMRPDVIAYTVIIKACVRAGDVDKAFEFFRELKEAGLRPNKVTYNTLFRAQGSCRTQGEIQRALALYEEMREAGYAPNDTILRVLLEQWAEGAVEDTGNGQNTLLFTLKFQKEVSDGFSKYSRSLLQRVAGHGLELDFDPNTMLDLHGLSRGEARIAVLAVLRIIKQRFKEGYPVKDDLVILTDVGTRSEGPGLTIARQAVLYVLEKELGLPVSRGPTDLPQISEGPDRMSIEDHFLARSSLDNQVHPEIDLVADTSNRDTFRSSDNGSQSSWKLMNSCLVVRKPKDMGRLVVSKDVLNDWLSKKHITKSPRDLVQPLIKGENN